MRYLRNHLAGSFFWRCQGFTSSFGAVICVFSCAWSRETGKILAVIVRLPSVFLGLAIVPFRSVPLLPTDYPCTGRSVRTEDDSLDIDLIAGPNLCLFLLWDVSPWQQDIRPCSRRCCCFHRFAHPGEPARYSVGSHRIQTSVAQSGLYPALALSIAGLHR